MNPARVMPIAMVTAAQVAMMMPTMVTASAVTPVRLSETPMGVSPRSTAVRQFPSNNALPPAVGGSRGLYRVAAARWRLSGGHQGVEAFGGPGLSPRGRSSPRGCPPGGRPRSVRPRRRPTPARGVVARARWSRPGCAKSGGCAAPARPAGRRRAPPGNPASRAAAVSASFSSTARIPACLKAVQAEQDQGRATGHDATVDEHGIGAGDRGQDDRGRAQQQVDHAGNAAPAVVGEQVRPDIPGRVEFGGQAVRAPPRRVRRAGCRAPPRRVRRAGCRAPPRRRGQLPPRRRGRRPWSVRSSAQAMAARGQLGAEPRARWGDCRWLGGWSLRRCRAAMVRWAMRI